MIGQKPRIFATAPTNQTAQLACKCPHCPAEIKVMATLEDGKWEKRWLSHYGVPHRHQPLNYSVGEVE